MPMPPIKKIPPKYWMYGAAVVFPILKAAGRAVIDRFSADPRTCPSCSYATVSEVARRRTRSEKLVHYWRCSACAARYRSNASDGPFSKPTDRDWATYVRARFIR